MEFTEALRAAAAAAGIALSEAQLAAFTRYYELLIAWNEKMNLTAITAPEDVAVKHIIDSLAAYDAALSEGKRPLILALEGNRPLYSGRNCESLGADARAMAQTVFSALRDADEKRADVIFSESVEAEGIGLAVMNRLGRAAAFHIEEV